jgi:hypothetical protein
VLTILSRLKFEGEQDPLLLLYWALEKASARFELRENKLIKPPKKQKGRPKLRGRLFPIIGARVRRRAVKDFLKYSSVRIENTAIDRIVEEILDIDKGRGITPRRKRSFYNSINGARATLEVIKRHRRRKRINRL